MYLIAYYIGVLAAYALLASPFIAMAVLIYFASKSFNKTNKSGE